jgi:hypothetical protein
LTGFLRNFMPASFGSLPPFLLLHSTQLQITFDQVVLPPLEMGTT